MSDSLYREWLAARKLALKLADKKCNRCGTDRDISVHHRDENRQNNDQSNLEVLCRPCHQKHHHPTGTRLSEETKAKIVKIHLGSKRTDETRNKISKAAKQRFAEGRNKNLKHASKDHQ